MNVKISAAAMWLVAKLGVVVIILTLLLLAGAPVKPLANGARTVFGCIGYGVGLVFGSLPDVAKAITGGFELAQDQQRDPKAVPAVPKPTTPTEDKLKSIPPNLRPPK